MNDSPLINSMHSTTYRVVNGLRFGTLAAIAFITGALMGAGPSDPVRNANPERATPPPDVEHPIYSAGPLTAMGDSVVAGDVNMIVPEAILQTFVRAHSAMNYPAAIEAAMRLTQMVPDRPVGHYNLACALARAGRVDEAYESLARAVECGWRDVLHTTIDPDLVVLRSDARFTEIIREMRGRVDAERLRPLPLRSDGWENAAADLAREVPSLLTRHHVPGAAVAIIDNGRVVWSGAFGRRGSKSDAPALRVDNRFRVRAPLHVLAMAVCEQLEREGGLRLAALIMDAAHQHADAAIVRAVGSDSIAARPAGMRNSGMHGETSERAVPAARPVSRMYARNSVYGSLRIAAELASGETFTRLCERLVFSPLAMQRSTFGMPGEDDPLVAGHSALGTPLQPSAVQGEFAPGGCLYSTVDDLARLIAAAMSGTDTTAEHAALGGSNDAIFAEDSHRTLQFGSAVDLATSADATLGGLLELAVKRVERGGEMWYRLDETAAGVVLHARWHPASRRGVVVLCNSVTANDAAMRIAQIVLGGE